MSTSARLRRKVDEPLACESLETIRGVGYRSVAEMKYLHCHLCGATLRRAEQFHELARPDRNDIIYLCRDETRCATRAIFDPPTRRSADPQSTRRQGE
jgi:hypothetical protein